MSNALVKAVIPLYIDRIQKRKMDFEAPNVDVDAFAVACCDLDL